MNSNTTPQPVDERPTEEEITVYQQPDDELPTAAPTGVVDVHVLLPTKPPSESHATAYSCSQDGNYYQDGQNWTIGACTTCKCLKGKIRCSTPEQCPQGTFELIKNNNKTSYLQFNPL